MPDTVDTNRAFDTIRDAVADEFATSGDAMIADIRDMLSVPVTYTSGKRGGKKAVRSVTPKPPRLDSGALWASISKAVEVGLYGVDMAVYTDKVYSAKLQSDDFISGPRLHWSTLADNWLASIPQRLAQKIQQL